MSAFDITRVSIISNLSFSDVIFGHISVRILKRPRRGIKIYVFLCDQDTDPRKMTARDENLSPIPVKSERGFLSIGEQFAKTMFYN